MTRYTVRSRFDMFIAAYRRAKTGWTFAYTRDSDFALSWPSMTELALWMAEHDVTGAMVPVER